MEGAGSVRAGIHSIFGCAASVAIPLAVTCWQSPKLPGNNLRLFAKIAERTHAKPQSRQEELSQHIIDKGFVVFLCAFAALREFFLSATFAENLICPRTAVNEKGIPKHFDTAPVGLQSCHVVQGTETTPQYVEANMTMKEEALSKRAEIPTRKLRFRASDKQLQFREGP